jgi:transposase InsO family protein
LTFQFIADHAKHGPVTWMCEALAVSVSGYHAWAGRTESPAEPRRRELRGVIEEVHVEVKHRYGRPRMTPELYDRGYTYSENLVAKLMKTHGVRAQAPKRFLRTTDSDHHLPVAENLLNRAFDASGPDEAWSADITCLPAREGWLYLAAVEDLFSRMIVGWSMDATMASRLVVDALEVALVRRRPGAGLLAHSDRGSQYASAHYQRVLSAVGIVCSMSGVGQCWDNAPVESFFGRLKCEVAPGEMFATRDPARAELFEYLEVFYNRVRRHSSLGFVSPVDYERAYNQKRR